MPTVRQLIDNLNQDKKTVITTESNESLTSALNKMLEDGFTQLPFLHDGKYYFLTTASILCALSAYGGTISGSKLNVSHAKVDLTTTHTDDDDIFEVMKEVERSGAALIVDDKGINNIITAYDTALYFQQWSEDTMHVREIEREIKDIINHTFKDEEGKIDIYSRQLAVNSVTTNFFYSKEKLLKGLTTLKHLCIVSNSTINVELFMKNFNEILTVPTGLENANEYDQWEINAEKATNKKVKKCLISYCKAILNEVSPSEDVLKKAFPDVFGDVIKDVEFDELTLGQYIQILRGPSWEKCQSYFGLVRENILYILDGVRETRNKLAHFQEERITPQNRTQLRLCNDLLQKTKREMFRVI